MHEALKYIDYLENQTTSRLGYARELVRGRTRAAFLPDDLYHCNFAGYVLATIVKRKTEVAVYIQDCDDWGMELIVDSVDEAERIFDELFHDCPTYDANFEHKLKRRGFVHI